MPFVIRRPKARLGAASCAPWLLVALALCSVWRAGRAHANGRQPNTTGIAVDPHDANRLLAGVTFGAIVSTDAGLNWHWVCEQVLGGPSGVDAQVAITGGGTLLVANPNGLFAAMGDGCAWAPVGNFGAPRQTTRFALHPTLPNTWLLAVNDIGAGGGLVYRTTDAGATFSALSMPMAGVYVYSIAFAPSAPTRLYAGGSNNGSSNSAYLFRSDDAGTTWASTVIASAPAASAQTRVAASPVDADIVFVGAEDVTVGNTVVLRSTDAGATWAAVLTVQSVLRDITFSDDGHTVWVAGTASIARSDDGGKTFTFLAAPVYDACATFADGTLYACGNEASGDAFTVGTSDDGGATWAPVVGLSQIQGPFGCDAQSNGQSVCMPLWANEAAAIGAPVQPVARTPTAAAVTPSTGRGPDKGGCTCQDLDASGASALALLGLATRARRRWCSAEVCRVLCDMLR